MQILIYLVLALGLTNASWIDLDRGIISIQNRAVYDVSSLMDRGSLKVTNEEESIQIVFGLKKFKPQPTSMEEAHLIIRNMEKGISYISRDEPEYAFSKIQNPNEGFLIKYELEDIRQKSVVLLNFKCSDEEWEAFPVKESREAGIVYYTAKILTSAACVDAEANKFINFLNEYWLIFGALFLGFGCYITFIGWKKWRINFQVIVAVPTFFISTLNIFGLFSFSTPEIVLWIALLVCAGGSYYVGRYAYQNLKIGFYMIGSYMGIIIGLLLYQSVFANLHYFNLLVIGLMITILAVLGGVLGLRYWQDTDTYAAAILGPFVIIRTVASIIGGYPNEIDVFGGIHIPDETANLYIVFFIILAGVALNQIPKKIPFSLRPKRLSWLDFTGEVKPDHTFWAYTTWKISYRYEPKIYSDKIELKVTVNPYLDKNNSYVREEKKSGELLMHEQQHYNIGCLCAMDFKKRCDNFKFTLAFYKGQIKRLFDESLNEYLKFEKEYDIETDHFRNKEMQKQWEIIIRDALFNYKEFW